jgi:hypothetical protein
MDGTCNTHGRDKKFVKTLVGELVGDHSEDIGVDRRIMYGWLLG